MFRIGRVCIRGGVVHTPPSSGGTSSASHGAQHAAGVGQTRARTTSGWDGSDGTDEREFWNEMNATNEELNTQKDGDIFEKNQPYDVDKPDVPFEFHKLDKGPELAKDEADAMYGPPAKYDADSSKDPLARHVRQLTSIRKLLQNRRQSIMDIELDRGAFRMPSWDKLEWMGGMHPQFKFFSKEFYHRCKDLGILADTTYDHERRLEALKRDYLRYRRKRRYQQLTELGITNRRPRRVTKQQYQRFQEYLATGRYPYGRQPGPSYVKGDRENPDALIRKDVADDESKMEDDVWNYFIYKNKPHKVRNKKMHIEEFDAIEDFTLEKLAETVRGKSFDIWRDKREWLFVVMSRVQTKLQAVVAKRDFLIKRQDAIGEYNDNAAPLEYDRLAADPALKRSFEPPRGPWEAHWNEGFIKKLDDELAVLERKRLLVKSEIDKTPYKHTDSMIERHWHGILADQEYDEDELRAIRENPFLDRYTVISNQLATRMHHESNPDLFLRFTPPPWGLLEKKRMEYVNQREASDKYKNEVLGKNPLHETHGAHWDLLNSREEAKVDTKHQQRVKEVKDYWGDAVWGRLQQPRIAWARAIANALPFDQERDLVHDNPYTFAHVERIFNACGGLQNKDEARHLVNALVHRMPKGCDIDPNPTEAEWMHKEAMLDEWFGEDVVRWFAEIGWAKNFGYHHNQYRELWMPIHQPLAFFRKELPETGDGLGLSSDDNGAVNFAYVQTTNPSHRTKSEPNEAFKSHWICGNGKGSVGFGIGRARTVEDAHTKAKKQGERSMIYVPLYQDRALYHHLQGKWNGTIVKFIATPPGYGIVAPPLIRLILECAGIKDATAMMFGNRNPVSVIKAAFLALSECTDLEAQSWTRGRKLIKMAGEIDGTSYMLPQDFHRSELHAARRQLREYQREHFARADIEKQSQKMTPV